MAPVEQLLVECGGRTLVVDDASSTMTVGELQQLISDRVGLPAAAQHCWRGSTLLSNAHDTIFAPDQGRQALPIIRITLSLPGGKGGFGSLLRGASRKVGQKQTSNFSACRDLNGRRLRHVETEQKLAAWQQQEHKVDPKQLKEQFKTIKNAQKPPEDHEGGRKKKNKGDILEAPKLNKDGSINLAAVTGMGERKMCKFGDACKYQWKCKYMHPGQAEKLAAKGKLKHLRTGFGENETSPMYEATHESLAAAVEQGLSNMQSSKEDQDKAAKKRKAEAALAVALPSIPGVDDDDDEDEKQSSTAASSSSNDGSMAPPAPKRQKMESLKVTGFDDSDSDTEADTQMAESDAANATDEKAQDAAASSASSSSAAADAASSSSPAAAAAAAAPAAASSSVSAAPAAAVDAAAAVPKPSFAAVDLSGYNSAAELEALGGDHLKAELTRQGLKCGGTVKERAERLFLLKTQTLATIPKKHLAQPPK